MLNIEILPMYNTVHWFNGYYSLVWTYAYDRVVGYSRMLMRWYGCWVMDKVCAESFRDTEISCAVYYIGTLAKGYKSLNIGVCVCTWYTKEMIIKAKLGYHIMYTRIMYQWENCLFFLFAKNLKFQIRFLTHFFY